MFEANYALKKAEKFAKPELPTDVETPDFLANPKYKEPDLNTMQLKSDYNVTGGAISQDNAPLKESTLNPSVPMDMNALLGTGLEAAGSVMSRFSGDPLDRKEASAATFKMAADGAKLGMALGGPLGAAGGALVMGGIGAVKGQSDKKKITKMQNEKQTAFLAKTTADREEEQRIADGEAKVGKLQSLYKSQLGMLS